MDEADRLLDMGFKRYYFRFLVYDYSLQLLTKFNRDIDQITTFLNQRKTGKRQTLLFSATISEDIKKIAKTTLLPGYQFIDTVGDDAEDQTHAHVRYSLEVYLLNQELELDWISKYSVSYSMMRRAIN